MTAKPKQKPRKTVFLPPTRVTEELAERTYQEAERQDIGVSTLMRKALMKYLPKKR